jgi:hypothetical protein
MRPGPALIILISFAIYVPNLASSQTDNRFRVVIIENGQREFGIRLASEIRAQGMISIIIEAPMNINDPANADTLLAVHNAAALMEISADGSRIVIYLQDSPVRPEILIDARDENTQSIFVFKSVEMVRAMLLSAPIISPAAREANQPPPPTAVKKSRPITPGKTYRHVGVSVQPGMVHGSGNLPPEFSISTGIIIRLTRNLYISTGGLFPITRMELQKPEGKITARATLAGITLASSWSVQPTVKMHAGIGFSSLFLSTKGITSSPYVSESKLLITALPQINVGVSIGRSNRFQFRVDVMGGWTLHDLKLRTAMGNETDFGPLMVGVCGGIEAWLF